MKFLSLASLLYIFEEFLQIFHSHTIYKIFFNIMDLMIFFYFRKAYIYYVYIYKTAYY